MAMAMASMATAATAALVIVLLQSKLCEASTESSQINVAGSSTVYPVAHAWAEAEGMNAFDISIEGGGSSSGARRVCAPSSDPSHVDIGTMSRDWKSKEAVLLDDGYTFECKSSKVRVTQIQVGVDGLAVVVAKNSKAHDCLTNPSVGGVTLAMLHWMFTSWNNTQLEAYGVNLASTLPNDDGDDVREWSDLSSACEEVPINAYGPGSESGTFDFFAEATLCKDCFAGKEGHVAEDFNYCSSSHLHILESLNGTGMEDYIKNQRPKNCYMSSESDLQLVQWLLADAGGIAYFGYSYYTVFASQLTVVRVASDRNLGVADTADAKVEPSIYTITDGSYSVYKRKLFMNVDNSAWDRVYPYLSYGFNQEGQRKVVDVGYVPVNAALLAKMQIRIEKRGNEEADYVSVAPSTCPPGTELSAEPFVNQFGTNKVKYTCTLCPPGKYKSVNTPTECSVCEAGKYTDQAGESECHFCDPGYEAFEGISCHACQPGSYKKEVAAESCSLCDPGTFTNQSAQSDCSFCLQGYFAPENSTECTPCPLNEMAPLPRTGQCSPCGPGFITRHVASTSCFRCKVGTYRLNETQCVKCPGRKTTAYQGAATIEECVCPAETYLADGLRDEMDQHLPSGSCVDCGEGLTCGLGSDMRHFEDFMKGKGQHGDEEDGEDQMDQSYPLVQAGYFARTGELTSVFRCGAVIDCPGGLPGTCAAGRTGALCGHCEAGWKTSSDGCEPCVFLDFSLFSTTFMVMMLAGVPFFYYFMNSPMTSKASTLLSTAIAFGMTMTLLQTVGLVGIVKMKWPEYMEPLMDFASLFMLDLRALNLSCWGFKPFMSYINSVLLWPGALLWLFLCGAISRLLPLKYHFERAKALSTGGQIFQIGFTIMSKTALLPFMCYTHPNGKSSVLELSDVICWESEEHIIMVIFGVSMVAVMCSYWVFLLFLTCIAPAKSKDDDGTFFKTSRFLFFRFRPDYWWYGTCLILRGPMLAVPMAVFTDLPQVQLFVMTAVLEVYMVLQLVVMSMLLILLLSVASAFLDPLEGDVRAAYSALAGVLLASLYSVTFILLVMVLTAFFHRAAMGSHDELAVLTLGKPPSTTALLQGLSALCEAIEEVDVEFLVQTIDEFNVYDRRMLANVLTTVAPYFDNDQRMRLLNQMRISSVSLSTYTSERDSRNRISSSTARSDRTNSDDKGGDMFNSSIADHSRNANVEEEPEKGVEEVRLSVPVQDPEEREERSAPSFEAHNRVHFAETFRTMEI